MRGCLPACRNFVVCLVAMVQLCMFCPPPPLLPLFFPPLFPPPPSSSAALLQATLDVVMNLQFHYIEKLWQTFWYSTLPSSDGNTTIANRSAHIHTRGARASVLNTKPLSYLKFVFFLLSTGLTYFFFFVLSVVTMIWKV